MGREGQEAGRPEGGGGERGGRQEETLKVRGGREGAGGRRP